MSKKLELHAGKGHDGAQLILSDSVGGQKVDINLLAFAAGCELQIDPATGRATATLMFEVDLGKPEPPKNPNARPMWS